MCASSAVGAEVVSDGPDLVIITGLSGAGKSEALRIFEDLGYYSIDNLPPTLLEQLVSLLGLPAGTQRKLAVVCDLRSQEFFSELTDELSKLDDREVEYVLLFMDASDETILSRYRSIRRRHPLFQDGMTIPEIIAREREALSSIREAADIVVDSTKVSAKGLRRRIMSLFEGVNPARGLNTTVFSFGFKHGTPTDVDIMIDVRFLPNPYYDPTMRSLTGHDQLVHDFVMDQPETKDFLESWYSLLDTMMSGFVHEGKQHLSIGIGCTGGQHRSVAIAQETVEHLRERGYRVASFDRDIEFAEVVKS